MAITKLQPFNLDTTGNYTFANITTNNANLGNAATANFFIGSGNNLSNIQAANVSGQLANALVAGTVYTNAQPNITSIGSLTGLTVSNATGVVNFTTTANVTLGAVANLHISGGTNGYVLSTDGSGVLTWVAQAGGGGISNISNGTSNVNIPAVNGNINFSAGGNANVVVITSTGANISGTANITGNLTAGNIIAGTGTGGNITNANVISANTFTASGNISGGNANLGNSVVANYFTGNFYGTANSATTAGTVTTAAQPNITSIGSLTGLTVSNATGVVNFTTTANVTLGAVANLHIAGGTVNQYLQTDGAGNLSWSTVVSGSTSNISNGNSNVNIPAANGNINFTAVGNTTMIVTGTGANISGTANVTGNLTAGNIIAGSGSGGNITNANVISANTFIALTSANFVSASNVNLGAVGNVKITGGTSSYVLSTDGTGNLSWVAQSGGAVASISNGNSNVNIPSANGNINFSAVGNANVVVITGTGANISGTANVTGNLTAGNIIAGSGSGGNITNANVISANTFIALTSANFTSASNVNLGAVGNVKITGGTSSYVLSTDGTGNLSWVAQSGGGGISNISNGNSNVNIPSANGNINFSAVGNANVVVITGTGANISGTANVTGNLTAGNIIAGSGSGGNITNANVISANTFTATGNISASNANLGNSVVANYFTGNFYGTANSATTAGTVTTNAQPNITSVGTLSSLTVTANITGGNLLGPHANGNSNVNIPSANGNINLTAVGNTVMVITGTGVNVAGTLNTGSGVITGNGSGLSSIVGANVTGQVGNSLIAGTVTTAAQPNITSVGTLTSLTATGNVTGGNLVTAGKVYASEMLNGGTGIYLSAGPAGYINFFTTGGDKASISDTGNIIASNLIANSTVFATTANISANVNAGNANLGNLVTANFFSGAGNNLSNIQAANISGQVANALIAGTVYTNAQPNITSVGTLTDLSVSGNGVFGGNLTVNGTLTYINSTTLSISDPIINLQTGPNGAAPVANSGKDVGTALNYYDTSAKIAWMGWDVSNAEIAFGSNVGISSEVVTFTELANIRSGNASLGNNVSANFFTGNGVYLTGITTSGVSNGNSNINIPAANGNVNISAVGNANVLVVTGTGANISGTLNVTGNATLGNIITSGSGGNITNVNVVIANTFIGSFANGNSNVNIPAANGNVNISADGNANVLVVTGTGANINGTANITGNLVTGNASLGNLVTANFFSGSGNNLSNIQASNITGQVANALIAGTVYTNAQPNITSVGTLTSLDVTGNISGGNANLGNLVTANFFAGNGSALSELTFGNITTFTTASLTTDELYLQATTRLNVTASGASGYLFDQYGATLNPALYITSGQTLAFNLNVSGHPFLIQTSGGANYSTGLEHVDTTGTVLSASSAQGQIAGTLYWKVPYGITGNYKYQCSVHGGMNGNIVVTDANVANIQVGNSLVSGTVYTNAQPNITSVGTLTSLDITGNITSGNANLGNAVTSNFFIGAGNNLSNIQGSNVSGQVSNSLIAGTVYTNAQPNITSVGSLTGLVVSNATGVVDFTTTANVTLGAVANLHISGGTGGYVLSTDGSGTLSWIAQSGGGSSTISNGNSNVNIPAANGNINFTAVGNTVMVITGTGANISGTLEVTGNLITGNANLGNAVIANYFIGSGNNLSNIQGSNVTGAVSSATTAGTVTTAAQPNITSVGSLTGLIVSNATGVVDFTTTANVTLGAVANLHISGGTIDYVLRTDGSGNLSWVAQSGGGGSPGGTNTQVQFNDASSFGGNAGFTFDKTTTTLTANNFVATSTANLGSNANVIITGGTNGYVLSTNGSGALSWVAQSGGGGGGANIANGTSNVNIPAAGGNINTSVGGTANVLIVTTTGINVAGTLDTGSGNATVGNLGTAQVLASANITSPQFISNIAIGTAPFVVTSTTQVANLSVATAGSATTAGTVTTNAQPNITSVGSLTGLVVSNATGVVDFTTTANVTLGAVANLHISGGTGGYVLSTDGSGTLSWVAQSGGAGASISNGNSNVNIPAANGNINFTAVSNTVMVITGTGANISGTLEVTGNSNVGNLNVSGNITDTTGTLTISTSGGTGGNLSLSADSVGRIILDGMAWPAADGTNGYVLQTNGANDLSWVAQASSTITDNTTSVSTFYPVYATASSGSFTTAGISSTKLQFIPSTGTLTVTDLNTLSDATLKENSETITDPMVVLSQLFGMGFNWIDTKKKSYGLMAQMVEKILPELVSTNEQGQKALNYIPIIAFLIEAVKKQQEDIDNLKKRSIKKR